MKRIAAVSVVLVSCLFFLVSPIIADTTQELQQQINDQNAQIDSLKKEIAQYETQLTALGSKKQTLQNTLSTLSLQRKQLSAKISLSQKSIAATEREIAQLSGSIADKEDLMTSDRAGLAETMRSLDESDGVSLVESMLKGGRISDLWTDTEATLSLQTAVRDRIEHLATVKQSLSDDKTASEKKRAQLLNEKQVLTNQQTALSLTIKSQNDLLSQTKSQESTYQALIAKKKAQEAAFESALTDLKAQLDVAVNPSQITPTGKGVLQWPVDNVRITQYFGDTAFARSGAYNGKGHNGIDLAASIGTPIHAALSGTVIGTGNTDAVRGCYSFGKWVMVKHANGLDTMYAHLSQINVSQGQAVTTGQLLGYSGETGYATGPHLHFGVYVSSVTQILKLGSATQKTTPCSSATMPVAPLSGYLNPASYLP
jgi:murein DD-endopeptidase MepM/ murein hydrolase activator NlpD